MRELLLDELNRVAGGYDPEDPFASFDPGGGDGGIGDGGDDGGGGDPGDGGGDPDPITTDALVDEILDLIDQEIANGANYLDPAWTPEDEGGGQVGHDQNSYYYETLGQQIMGNFDMQFQAFQEEAGNHFAQQQAVTAFQASLNQAIANGNDIAPYLSQLGYNLPPGTVTAAHTAGGQTVYTFTESDGDVSPVIITANCNTDGSIASLVFTSGQGWNIAGGIYDRASQAMDMLDVIKAQLALLKNANAVNDALVTAADIDSQPNGTWEYAISDEDGDFAGHVTITDTGWFFEDVNGNVVFSNQFAVNWGALDGVTNQEQLSFQDRVWGAPLAKWIEVMWFGPLFRGIDGAISPIAVEILTKLGFNASAWSAGQGNPNLFVRAQEAAYEMRKLKLQGYQPTH